MERPDPMKTTALITVALLGLSACTGAPQETTPVTEAPAPVEASAPPQASAPVQNTAALETAIAQAIDAALPAYQSAMADLNADGREDAVVLLSGNEWCGSGGCTMLVLKGEEAEAYTLVSRSTVTRAPIRVAASASNGWKDLIVSTRGLDDALMAFDGSGYPGNPSVQSAASAEQVAAAATIIE